VAIGTSQPSITDGVGHVGAADFCDVELRDVEPWNASSWVVEPWEVETWEVSAGLRARPTPRPSPVNGDRGSEYDNK